MPCASNCRRSSAPVIFFRAAVQQGSARPRGRRCPTSAARSVRSRHDVGGRAHAPRINTGCPISRVRRRHLRVAGAEGARRAFPVHAHALPAILLHLGDVVRDVVSHTHVFRAHAGNEAHDRFPHGVADELPVRPREVRRARHRRQVVAALGSGGAHARAWRSGSLIRIPPGACPSAARNPCTPGGPGRASPCG